MGVSSVRVRFAPSPTGPLHIGGLRTALYNYLFATKMGGTFVLRIEDTDARRFVAGATEYIYEALAWCGIVVDEGPQSGGDYGPYVQSARKNFYTQAVQRLLDSQQAYIAFDTPEELGAMRKQLQDDGAHHQHYNVLTRQKMCNSFTLSAKEVQRRLEQKIPHVIRLNVPIKEVVMCSDLLHGELRVHAATLEDKVLIKADGIPTYHFAHVVDDYHMGITHVIRGEEWLPSLPVHVLLWQALGWEEAMPVFVHLPIILSPSGSGKLSKRVAQTHGMPIYPLSWEEQNGFRELGYLPEAVMRFLICLGWTAAEQWLEWEELVRAFELERLSTVAQRIDLSKARWFNEQAIRRLSAVEVVTRLRAACSEQCAGLDDKALLSAVELFQSRATVLPDFITQTAYLRAYPETPLPEFSAEAHGVLERYASNLATRELLPPVEEKALYLSLAAEENIGTGKALKALRLTLTAEQVGPDIMEIAAILGKDLVLDRLRAAL